MASGPEILGKPWSIEDLAALVKAAAPVAGKREPYKKASSRGSR